MTNEKNANDMKNEKIAPANVIHSVMDDGGQEIVTIIKGKATSYPTFLERHGIHRTSLDVAAELGIEHQAVLSAMETILDLYPAFAADCMEWMDTASVEGVETPEGSWVMNEMAHGAVVALIKHES